MADEHVIISPETTFGTFVTPALAFPIMKASHAVGREYIDRRYSGSARALAKRYQGSKSPSGSIETDLFPDEMGNWFEAAGFVITTSQDVGATTAYEHGLLLSTSSLLSSLSAQIKRSASVATNILSMIMDKVTLKCAKGEVVMVTFDFLAKDEAPAGGTWDHDGGASDAVIATPTYISASLVPYRYFDAALILGGTVSLDGTTKQMSISGGTTLSNIESLEITIENNLEQAHFLTADPTAGQIPAQDFNAAIQMDVDQSTLVATYYNHVRGGTNAALQLTLTGPEIEAGHDYMFELTLPSLSFDEADYPEVSGDQSRRVQKVQASAIVHTTIDEAIGITIRDSQASY